MFENPEIVKDKRILELGCGPGLTGMLAAKLAAREVVLTDYHEEIVEGVNKSIIENHIQNAEARILNWTDPPIPNLEKFDLIIASDIIYEESLNHEKIIPQLLQYYLIDSPLSRAYIVLPPNNERDKIVDFENNLAELFTIEKTGINTEFNNKIYSVNLYICKQKLEIN